MHAKIQKWGNSLALRIPRGYAHDVHITAGAAVEMSIDDGRIIIDPRPAIETPYTLAGLLKQVTPKNRHAAIETGQPVGKEQF